jgi:hypothetical protein
MIATIHEALTEIAKKARAIIPCEHCGSYEIIADDEEAELLAHAMAINAWKRGEFGRAPLEAVGSDLQVVLRVPVL